MNIVIRWRSVWLRIILYAIGVLLLLLTWGIRSTPFIYQAY